jgi:hypothetical protein
MTMLSLIWFAVGAFAGAALGVVFHRKIAGALRAELAAVKAELVRAESWRGIANGFAKELQDLRTRLPRRDPKTHRFVKKG